MCIKGLSPPKQFPPPNSVHEKCFLLVNMGDGDTLEASIARINAINKSRTDTPFSSPNDDYHAFDKDLKLPFLPYSFNSICAFCGTMDITIDRKRTIPITFLAKFLEDCCCKTPFVYNILYQMCHYPNLEMEEAKKAQDLHGGKPIPDHLRGRISLCPLCMPIVNERAKVSPGAGVLEIRPSVLIDGVKPTHEAFRNSLDPRYDDWVIDTKNRIIDNTGDQYTKEPGRKIRRSLKFMLLMDTLFHMVHAPTRERAPEYRMSLRAIRTMMYGSGVGISPNFKTNGRYGDLKCLYSLIPSIPMKTLLMHVETGQIKLKGGKGSALTITIADRIFMSAFVSGGKRRVSRSDSKVGWTIRRCNRYLLRGNVDASKEDEEVYFGGL